MSKAVRLGVIILAVLVLASAVVAWVALTQKQTLQGQNQTLQGQIQGLSSQVSDEKNKEAALQTTVKKLQDDAQGLNDKITQTQQEKEQVQSLYDELKSKSTDLQSQLDQANSDRDDWKNRVDTVTRERNDLMEKLKNRPFKIMYKDRVVKVMVPQPAPAAPVDVTAPGGDQYWAAVLKEKTSLQLQLEKAKAQLDQIGLQIVELKKENSDLSMQVKQVTDERDEARSRNSGVINDSTDKLRDENLQLASQIKDLTTTKMTLEQTVSRLTDEKDAIQKQLIQAQGSSPQGSTTSSAGGMELPPIIINAPAPPAPVAPAAPAVKTQGSIISINDGSNFIIADLGQANSAVSVGSILKVFRGTQTIATLNVIQVRRDICAADIQNKTTELNVGDVVKLM